MGCAPPLKPLTMGSLFRPRTWFPFHPAGWPRHFPYLVRWRIFSAPPRNDLAR